MQSRRRFLTCAGATLLAAKPTAAAPVIRVQAIRFDHDIHACTQDALTIRRNFFFESPRNAWESGRNFTLEPSIATYAISTVSDQELKIGVQFGGVDGTAFYARAIEPDGTSQNVLGTIPAAKFESYSRTADTTALLLVPLEGAHITGAGIGKYNVRWQWQYRLTATEAWKNIDLTEHTIYTTLNAPTSPWRQPAPNDLEFFIRDNTQLPWTEALDFACTWARGARGEAEIIRQITDAIYKLGKKPVTYQGFDNVIQYDELSDYAPSRSAMFRCTSFLNLLKGTPDRRPGINCSDCATAVSTFANLLGCNLAQMRIAPKPDSGISSFDLCPHWLLGNDNPNAEGDFTYHEVAWEGAAGPDALVSDACVQLDFDTDPIQAPHDWKNAVRTPFGRPDEPQYLSRLVAPEHRDRCAPIAAFRRSLDMPEPSPVPQPRVTTPFISAMGKTLVPSPGATPLKTPTQIASAIQSAQIPVWRVTTTTPKTDDLWTGVPLASVPATKWFFTSTPDLLVEVTTVTRDSPAQAQETLIEILADSHRPLYRLPPTDNFGRAAFATGIRDAVFIVIANVLILIESVGRQSTNVLALAQELYRRLAQ